MNIIDLTESQLKELKHKKISEVDKDYETPPWCEIPVITDCYTLCNYILDNKKITIDMCKGCILKHKK